jgi:anti-sigma factor RsiW
MPGTGKNMHDSAMNELERHFSGDAPQSFYDHLAACPECREEVAAMDGVSLVLREMKAEPGNVPEPRLGFYNRVAGEIIDKQRKEAWGLFSPGAAFFRRVAFASLLVLASLGSFLVTRENAADGADAAAVLAEHGAAAPQSDGADRDQILVTLASYR